MGNRAYHKPLHLASKYILNYLVNSAKAGMTAVKMGN